MTECINNSYWLDMVNLRLHSLFEHNEECRRCDFSSRCCGGCRAEAMTYEPNSYFGKSPVICEMYKGGWPEKIIALMKTVKPEAECLNLRQK